MLDLPPGPTATPPYLPARLPQATALLRRAQGTLAVLRDVVQESSAEYWYEWGKRASAAADWAEAEYAFGRCVSLNAEHWRGFLQLTYCYGGQQQLQNTLTGLRRAYDSTAPSFTVFCHELEISQWNSLKSFWLEVPTVIDNHYDLLFALALVNYALAHSSLFHSEGESGGSRDLLDELNELYPHRVENDRLWFKLSGCLRQYEWSDGFSNSLNDLEKAVALGADDVYTYCLMGACWAKFGKYYEALNYFNKCVEMLESEVLYFIRAETRTKLEDYSGAFDDVCRGLALDPSNFGGRHQRALLGIETGDCSNALEDLNFLMREHTNYWLNYDVHPCRELSYFHQIRASARKILGDEAGAEADKAEAKRFNEIAAEDWAGLE